MPTDTPRPHLSTRILAFALADAFGVFAIVLGSSWFIAGKGAIVSGFPNSLAEAVAALLGGLAVVLWAMFKLLGELRPRPRISIEEERT